LDKSPCYLATLQSTFKKLTEEIKKLGIDSLFNEARLIHPQKDLPIMTHQEGKMVFICCTSQTRFFLKRFH